MPLPFQKLWGARARKAPANLLGLDLGSTGVKAVRFHRTTGGLSVAAVDMLPPVDPASAPGTVRLALPKKLQANYVALAFSCARDVVRLVNLPGRLDYGPNLEAQVREFMKTEGEQRLNYRIMGTEQGKTETRVLAVAVPEEDSRAVLGLVASGAPAPYALEVASLAGLTAYLRGPGLEHDRDAVCVLEAGARMTLITFLNRGLPVLIRKLDWGGAPLVERVQTHLGLDRETALGTLVEGSVDIASAVEDLLAPFLKQLTISRDFVERQENCQVGSLFVSGGTSLFRHWLNEIRAATGMEIQPLNPFKGLMLDPGAYPAALEGQQARFAAAVGAALGALEEA